MAAQDYCIHIRPLVQHYSGDTGLVVDSGDTVFLALADALGHGREAWTSAEIVRRYMEKNHRMDLAELVEGLHDHVRRKGARGAVIGLCRLEKKTGALRYLSIGDITIRKFGATPKTLVSFPGIVGEATRTLRPKATGLDDGDVLALYSDGVKYHFGVKDYPLILKHDAGTIARNLIEKFGKDHDDASCIVLRYRK
ncbi:MAG: stage II sporulation protein E (SpoIIE) [Deltaproteobacteria bacterium]|nr:MAG: stage II sporulation protein E (SpoIIE) [Deltaproteobacteria bacterium]